MDIYINIYLTITKWQTGSVVVSLSDTAKRKIHSCNWCGSGPDYTNKSNKVTALLAHL